MLSTFLYNIIYIKYCSQTYGLQVQNLGLLECNTAMINIFYPEREFHQNIYELALIFI